MGFTLGGGPKVKAQSGHSGPAPSSFQLGGGPGVKNGANVAPKRKSGGGFLGKVEGAAHFVAAKSELAAHDIKSAPGGAIDFVNTGAVQPWKDFLTTGHVSKKHSQAIDRLQQGLADQTAATIAHPLRDPLQTLLLAAPVAHAAGTVAGTAGALGKAARAGDVAGVGKALYHTPTPGPRLLKVGDKQIALEPSKSPAVRVAQKAYDKTLQRGLEKNQEGRVAAHAQRRAGGAMQETARYQQRMREAPANALEHAGKKAGKPTAPFDGGRAARAVTGPHRLFAAKVTTPLLNKMEARWPEPGAAPVTGQKVSRKLTEAAMRLTSENSTPAEAAKYHLDQAAKGVAVKENTRQAKVYQAVDRLGLLTKDEHGNVVVNAAKHPALAAVDKKLAAGQRQVSSIITEHGLMTPEGVQERLNAPGRIRAGAEYVAPTPGRLGQESQGLIRQRAYVARLERLHGQAAERALKNPASITGEHLSTFRLPEEQSPTVGRLSSALSVAKDRLAQLEAAHARRIEPTGIVGGESARPGRGYVTYKTVEKRAPSSPVAQSGGAVTGEQKSFVEGHPFTGEGMAQGKVPDNTTRLVAQQMRRAYRYVNTDQFRKDALQTGSETRRSSRDVLVKIPGETAGKIPAEIDQALGRSHVTTDELAGHEVAFQDFMHRLIPGLRDNFATDAAQQLGVKAPQGYRWVDKGVLGDLARPAAGQRGRIARSADNINSAVTAATVYFKIGHIGTRVLTNAATNIIQGSASPVQIGKSVELWKQLADTERFRALAASGQHGFAALPHEGTSMASRVAGKGANWWAKHADAPFRFNSIAYEARKAGFKTPAQFRDLLDKLENPHKYNMNAAESAKVDWVAKRANREGIAYDRLNSAERQYITRGVWFYPWIKGATVFAGRTLTEHPYKAAAIGQAGAEGRKAQALELGDVPSYEGGLFQLRGGAKPLVADFSTFSPYATPADVLGAVARPAELSGFLNPVYGAITQAAYGLNQHGGKSSSPIKDALTTLVSPTPEAQIVTGYLHRHQNQNRRMFPASPALSGTASPLLRALIGPGMPRRYNPAAGRRAAALERSGR